MKQTSFHRGSFPYSLVGCGGSFDHLHSGHHLLLQTAFRLGNKVAIGLTTDNLLQKKQHREWIESYTTRESHLRTYIEEILHVPSSDFEIIQLNDPFGPAITEKNLQAHVSSMETYHVALQINELRIQNGISPLDLIIIPLVTDATGRKFSSTFVREILAHKEEKV